MRTATRATLLILVMLLGGHRSAANSLSLSESIEAQAEAQNQPPPAPGAAGPVIQLGAGDTVSIEVYGKPELKTTTYVADNGSVLVPLAGAVGVAGLAPAEAADRIAKALKDGEFLVNPQVSITVTNSRSRQISVLGQVKTEGRFPLESNSTVFDLLALAGGRKEDGANVVYLLRTDAGGKVQRTPINLDSLSDPSVDVAAVKFQTGDTLFVPRIGKYYIQGEVVAPSQYAVEPEMTVMEAIARAGGITRRGSSSRIEIKRKQPDGSFTTVYPKLTDRVQPDDQIRVKESIF
ncbi:MAG: hypothetical protein NVS9B10_23040 [Nevskia sp.]